MITHAYPSSGFMRGPALGASYQLAPVTEDTEWQLRGLCNYEDPEVFYPEAPELEVKSLRAKQVCQECPVLRACRTWALERQESFGVWGGLSEIDREAIWTGHRRYTKHSA